jgi:hypothetical protein
MKSGAWYCGRADAWYGRPAAPHYYMGGTYRDGSAMKAEQVADYLDGFNSIAKGGAQ